MFYLEREHEFVLCMVPVLQNVVALSCINHLPPNSKKHVEQKRGFAETTYTF